MPRGGVFYSKISFTLSEVLITLVIIGIISAVTIPFIIANYQEQERIAKVKKIYSTLANAMTYVKADGGDFDFVAYDNNQSNINDWFNTYLKPQLSVVQVCYNEKGCWNEGDSKYLNGKNVYYNRTGIGIGTNIVSMVLNDGTFVIVDVYSSSSIYSYFGVRIKNSYGVILYFDINGSKKPNITGKDIFAAVFTENGLVPTYKDKSFQEIEDDCKTNGTGMSCLMKYLSK